MHQTSANDKNLIFDLILAQFGPNLVPKNFFEGFTCNRCYTLLQAITA